MTKNIVALGDSYTKGQGLNPEESWPEMLVRNLNQSGLDVKLLANLANTGWTSKHLIDYKLPVFETLEPDLVTILIGANDIVSGVSWNEFQRNLALILDRVQMKLKNKNNVITLTIPDFTVTPNGKILQDNRDTSGEIEKFNTIIKKEAEERNLALVDLFPLSKSMENDASLVSTDGLHPSAKEYQLWEKQIFPIAREMVLKLSP